jgi:hypothetical protein
MSLGLRWYRHIERLNNERMKNNYVCQKKGRRKRGRPLKMGSRDLRFKNNANNKQA